MKLRNISWPYNCGGNRYTVIDKGYGVVGAIRPRNHVVLIPSKAIGLVTDLDVARIVVAGDIALVFHARHSFKQLDQHTVRMSAQALYLHSGWSIGPTNFTVSGSVDKGDPLVISGVGGIGMGRRYPSRIPTDRVTMPKVPESLFNSLNGKLPVGHVVVSGHVSCTRDTRARDTVLENLPGHIYLHSAALLNAAILVSAKKVGKTLSFLRSNWVEISTDLYAYVGGPIGRNPNHYHGAADYYLLYKAEPGTKPPKLEITR